MVIVGVPWLALELLAPGGSSDGTAPVVSIPSEPPRPQLPDSSDDEAVAVSIPSKPPRRRLRPVDSSAVVSSDEEVAAPVEQPTTATNDDDAALLASLRSLRRKSTLQPAAGLIRNIVSTQLNVVCTQRPVSTPSVLLLLRSNSSIVGHSWS